MKKVLEFLENTVGKIGIFFHCDADGVCSATLISKYFLQKGKIFELACGEIDKKVFESFARKAVDTAIFLDLAVDQNPSWLKKFKANNMLVIDHHPIHCDLNTLGIVHYNPRFEDPKIYRSASSICYEICKKLGIKNVRWVARVGACGDREILGTKKEREAVELIDAVKAIKGDKHLVKTVKILLECKTIDDFLGNRDLQKLREKLEKEVGKWVRNFSCRENICFYEIESKYSINSLIANKLFDKYPDKTIIVYSCKNGVYKFSGRSKKFDIGKVFEEAAKNIGKGGGHPVAAGAVINSKYVNTFIQRLKNLFKQKGY
jgi:single-stranded DNA-specific DHH superfamily exonuclease